MGISDSAAFTSPPVLILRRAMAMATFSLPWKYLLATSEDIFIRTLGSQSTSSVHSQWRFPSSPRPARMFTTRSKSSNSNRWGTSASRSLGPIPGSSLIIENTRSMTSRNCLGDSNSGFIAPPWKLAVRLAHAQALLVPRHRVGAPGQCISQLRDLARELPELRLDALEAIGRAIRRAGPGDALVEPIEAVLDPLEALGDGPHAARQALDV